jgi:hypothetical protein
MIVFHALVRPDNAKRFRARTSKLPRSCVKSTKMLVAGATEKSNYSLVAVTRANAVQSDCCNPAKSQRFKLKHRAGYENVTVSIQPYRHARQGKTSI